MTMERTAAKIGARSHAQQPFHDYLFLRLQAAAHDPQAVDHWADLNRAEFDLLLRVDDIDKLLRLI